MAELALATINAHHQILRRHTPGQPCPYDIVDEDNLS